MRVTRDSQSVGLPDMEERVTDVAARIVLNNGDLVKSLTPEAKERVAEVLAKGESGIRLGNIQAAGILGRKGLPITLASAVQREDPGLGIHHGSVKIIARNLAGALGLGADEVKAVGEAAIVHDIGKLDTEIARLIRIDKLTQAEKDLVAKHVDLSIGVAEYFGLDPEIIKMAAGHHKRADGTGYPNQNGESLEIHQGILGLADALQAMDSDRPGSPRKTIEYMIERVRDSVGGHFRHDVAQAFLQNPRGMLSRPPLSSRMSL